VLLLEPVLLGVPDVVPLVVPPIAGLLLVEELEEPGVVVLEPLRLPVPVAPIDDVPVVPVVAVVVSVLLVVLPVVVLGAVELALPLSVPLPVVPALPVVVDGVVVLDELADVPLVPAASFLWHAPRDRAATTERAATAVWVRVVFIRNSLEMGCEVVGMTLGGSRPVPVGTV